MKIGRKQKELIKTYIILFVVAFAIINWDNVSWLFNYKEMQGLAYDFFNPYQESYMLVSASENASHQGNSLEIPNIGLVTPVIISDSTNKAILADYLDRGVVYYPGSVLPGQDGQIVILGHSAPPNWPHIKHDWVFSDIENLHPGDQIILYFNNTKYTYSVTQKSIIQRGQEIGIDKLSQTSNILTIVSCWPPGKDYQRIAVKAILISPDSLTN